MSITKLKIWLEFHSRTKSIRMQIVLMKLGTQKCAALNSTFTSVALKVKDSL